MPGRRYVLNVEYETKRRTRPFPAMRGHTLNGFIYNAERLLELARWRDIGISLTLKLYLTLPTETVTFLQNNLTPMGVTLV